MIRIIDLAISLLALLILFPLIILVILIILADDGAPLFIQTRVGLNLRPFKLIKFRTMKRGTPSVGTHLTSSSTLTKTGNFFRRTKLDELPQLLNVISGDMSLVGPRPNLFNQEELIEQRTKHKVYSVRPGITGLAQIRAIDMSTPKLLAETDAEMIKTLNLVNYFKYLFLTLTGKGQGDRILKN